jgi:Flp pilus assembly protein CpaB
MNIENKKQVATILIAIGVGAVVAIWTGNYVKGSVEQQTKVLATEYQKKNAALINEVNAMTQKLNKLAGDQAALAQRLQQRPTVAQPVKAPQDIIDATVFSVITPPGKRAVTIMIDSLSAVGGLINPGDFVDIIAQLKIKDPQDPKKPFQEITSVLFQNIQVLAVGANFKPVGNAQLYEAQQRARSLNVTLALAPEEAGLLTFTQTNGKLLLSLRSPAEKETQALKVASWGTLSEYVLKRQGTKLEITKPKKAEGPAEEIEEIEEEERPFIQIFRGGREL